MALPSAMVMSDSRLFSKVGSCGSRSREIVDQPRNASRLRLERAAEIRPDTEIVSEHVEKRAPSVGIDMMGTGHHDVPMGMNPNRLHFDDPESLRPLGGPFATRFVRRHNLGFDLNRAFRDAQRPNEIGSLRRKVGDIELVGFESDIRSSPCAREQDCDPSSEQAPRS